MVRIVEKVLDAIIFHVYAPSYEYNDSYVCLCLIFGSHLLTFRSELLRVEKKRP